VSMLSGGLVQSALILARRALEVIMSSRPVISFPEAIQNEIFLNSGPFTTIYFALSVQSARYQSVRKKLGRRHMRLTIGQKLRKRKSRALASTLARA